MIELDLEDQFWIIQSVKRKKGRFHDSFHLSVRIFLTQTTDFSVLLTSTDNEIRRGKFDRDTYWMVGQLFRTCEHTRQNALLRRLQDSHENSHVKCSHLSVSPCIRELAKSDRGR